jgi:hypothetical protein
MKFLAKLLSTLLIAQSAFVFAKGNADMIFYGGDIVTMNKSQPSAEAVAVQDGKIIKVGSLAKLKAVQGQDTKLINLNGQTLMPGLVEPHVHIMGTAFSEEIFLDLSNFNMHHDTFVSLVGKLTDYG